ncbi:DUF4352 domain-containing protein [Lactococcus lactis]|uniref:DUF4352 domain-containing protein n=1 Tax=Lactococcus lactis TaxID=1358 RepID=A0AAP3Z2H6_9LACT|nr:DUF4352 domain-containing protein [Lactococcus lactis]MDG4969250.1 DUF4352 domain-containing protein [Lactococcus lactis]MDG4977181.1 DUF4352 domain-containing protein [Lactococcus lactis]MDG5103344.1 DUF4352 domain-containing protein [Lactococcus lactis]TNU78246.1 DUF4352 domain-containing protein [Lactococcus lactis subsp. lactis]
MKETQNRPFYRLLWFWISMASILIAIVCLIVAAAFTSKSGIADKKIASMSKSYSKASSFNKNFNEYMRSNVPDYDSYVSGYLDSGSSKSTIDSSTSSSENFTESFGTGQSFSNNDTDIEVNVLSANIDSSVTLSSEAESGAKPLVVTVSIKNTGNKAFSFNTHDFTAYDSEGSVLNLDLNTYDNDMPDSVNIGQVVQAKLYFDAKNDGPFSVTFADGTWK